MTTTNTTTNDTVKNAARAVSLAGDYACGPASKCAATMAETALENGRLESAMTYAINSLHISCGKAFTAKLLGARDE